MRQLNASAKCVVVVARGKKFEFPELIGNAVVVSDRLVDEDVMTSAPVYRFSASARNVGMMEKFTTEIPGAKDHEKAHLDENGLVRLGTPVSKGTILVGKVRKKYEIDLTPEDRLLISIFGHCGDNYAKDDSLRFPFHDSGLVCDRHPTSTKYPFDMDAQVVVSRRLQVGDVLITEGGDKLIVARILPRNEMSAIKDEMIDVFVSPNCSIVHKLGILRGKIRGRGGAKTHGAIIRLTKTTLHCEEKVIAFDEKTCGNSVVTRQPVSTKHFSGICKITPEKAMALAEAGYPENLREMMTLKSDALEALTDCYDQICRRGEGVQGLFPVPESIKRLEAILRGLAFFPIISQTEISIRPANDADIRGWSFGEVKLPETISYSTYKPKQDGLFCQRIFGPEFDYQCACGKYRGIKFKSIICDKCGVKVTHSSVRRRRFGHINLASPVVHPMFFSFIAEALGMDEEVLNHILYSLESCDTAYGGAEKISELLVEAGFDPAGLILNAVPVIPPDLRPIVMLEDGNFGASDANFLYERLIERNRRLALMKNLGAPKVIVDGEKIMLQQCADALMRNSFCVSPVLGYTDKPLHDLYATLRDCIKCHIEKKTRYCVRGIPAPSFDVKPGSIGLPGHIARTFYGMVLIGVLKSADPDHTIISIRRLIEQEPDSELVQNALLSALASRKVLAMSSGEKVAVFQPQVVPGESILLNPEDARPLDINFGGEELEMFLPLTEEARAELDSPQPLVDISRSAFDYLTEVLARSAWTREPIKLTKFDQLLIGHIDSAAKVL